MSDGFRETVLDGILMLLFLTVLGTSLILVLTGQGTSGLPYVVLDGDCYVPCLDTTGQMCMGPTPIMCPVDAGP